MCAARYMHTAEAHAGVMLGTVRGLAAGMGAVEVKGKDGEGKGERKVGNAVLGLWVGLRLYGELLLNTFIDGSGALTPGCRAA